MFALQYSCSLGELEQLKRGLQTAGHSALLEQHGFVMKDLFLHQDKKVTADFIQDLVEVEYSLLGSNYRFIEKAIIMNWLSYLKDLEGLCITIAKIVSLIIELLLLQIILQKLLHSMMSLFSSLVVRNSHLSHTEMTRLSQPCDKVVTTMSTVDKVVTTLWIGCHNLVTRL